MKKNKGGVVDGEGKKGVIEAIYKRAVGYLAEESVEEMSANDGELTLSKRRVTRKEVPPDPTSAKLIMDSFSDDPYLGMSEGELSIIKRRLLGELTQLESNQNSENKNKNVND